MKRLLLTALAMFATTPALAQTDKYDQLDWTWLDLTGSGPEGMLMLTGAPPVRNGNINEVDVFILYREVDENGAIGGRIHARFDCAAKKQAGDVATIFFSDGRIVEQDQQAATGMTSIEPANVIYRFACTQDRTNMTRYGKRPRKALADEIFAKYPARK